MRVIARQTLVRFSESPDGGRGQSALTAALNAWFHEVSRADWRAMADVKQRYAYASIINSERIVFNIKGNDYRLVAAVDFERSVLWIKWIGTHRQYDRIDAATVEYE